VRGFGDRGKTIMQVDNVPFGRIALGNAAALRGAFGRGVSARKATVRATLRTVESLLLFPGGQHTARRNAWDAVCADRRRARARAEATDILERLATADEPTRVTTVNA
jgi:hypothetical protein